jgi:uncharacterized protein YaiE (UPF0345 family)
MSELNNVTVIREANVYFDGNVTSRTIVLADGTKKTLGIMLPGEYTFNTDAPERMEILAGSLDVLLPGKTQWQTVQPQGNTSDRLLLLIPAQVMRAFQGEVD